MGRLSRSLLYSLTFCAIGAAQAASISSAPNGKNSKLDVAFQVEGGTHWCNNVVTITLTAKTAAPLREQPEEFQQMVGRIRGIIQGDCPQVRTISFHGRVGNAEISTAEAADFTGWRYLARPVGNAGLTCSGPDNPRLCDQRAGVFTRLRSLFMNDGFRRARLTALLDTKDQVDAEFRYVDAEGRVRFVPLPQGQQAPSPLNIVKRQIDGLAAKCAGTFQKSEAATLGTAAGQSLTCTTGNETHHSYFIIQPIGSSGLDILAFTDFTVAGLSGAQLYDLIKRVLLKVPNPDSDWDRIHDDTFSGLAIPNLTVSSCGPVAEKTGTVNDKMVAVRLRPADSKSKEFVLQVLDSGTAKADTWRMNFGVNGNAIKSASSLASWLVFRSVEDNAGRHFENQLVGINARNECAVLTTPARVSIEQMPVRAVQLYTKHLGLPVNPNDTEPLRAALREWEESPAPINLPPEEAAKLQRMQDTYPIPLMMRMAQFHQDCESILPGSSLVMSDKFVSRIDIDGDGKLDYVANGDEMACEDSKGQKRLIGGDNGGTPIWILSTLDSGPVMTLETLASSGNIKRYGDFAIFNNGKKIWRIQNGVASPLMTAPPGGEQIYTIKR